MVSHLHGLAGRPDYIRKQGEELIPVERKSRHLSPSGADELRGLILYVCGRGAGIPRPDGFFLSIENIGGNGLAPSAEDLPAGSAT